jgi:predicted flap endonuclease-1-like 5' DNA nuclease
VNVDTLAAGHRSVGSRRSVALVIRTAFTLAENHKEPYVRGMKLLAVLLVGSLALNLQAAEKPDAKKTKLISIQGIGEATEAKLNAAGINNVSDLLEEGSTPKGREEMAARSGLSAAQILKFVNYADLFRIKGIAGQTAELLEAAGVNTVAELAQRNASNLQVKLQQVNDAKKVTGKVPGEKQVAEWIEEAKTLPKRVTY